MRKTKEQELLQKLYECQYMMEVLLDKGKEDNHYFLIDILIKRLENHLEEETGII